MIDVVEVGDGEVVGGEKRRWGGSLDGMNTG